MCQLIQNDDYVNISVWYIKDIQSVLFLIENKSDSTLLFNDKQLEKYLIRDSSIGVDLSLVNTSPLNIIQPQLSTLLNFKRLNPKEKFVLAIYNINNIEDIIYFWIAIHFVVIPNNAIICDGIRSGDLISRSKKSKWDFPTKIHIVEKEIYFTQQENTKIWNGCTDE